jgi:hypothetical protein
LVSVLVSRMLAHRDPNVKVGDASSDTEARDR